MSYRDWERGDASPRERPPSSPWGGPGDRPVEPYARSPEGYRTRSRRRAAERGQQEPADDYLPRWAVESGVADPGGEGRHRHEVPADDGSPRPDLGWRTETTSTWRRVTETTSWHEAPTGGGGRELPAGGAGRSDHTGGWRFAEAAAGSGYVGSRRAADEGDDPSGTGTDRHRGLPSPRPRVVWSGDPGSGPPGADERWPPGADGRWSAGTDGPWPPGADGPWPAAADGRRQPRAIGAESAAPGADGTESAAPGADGTGWARPEAGTGGPPEVPRPSRRSRRAAEESWPYGTGARSSRRERGARHRGGPVDPVVPPPAVDPWDASGLHVWDRPADGGSESTSQWDRFTDTGQWPDAASPRGDVPPQAWPDAAPRWADDARSRRWDGPGPRYDSAPGLRHGAERPQGDYADGPRLRHDVPARWDGAGPRRDDVPARWDDDAVPRRWDGGAESEGWSWSERDGGFWSGTRLSGDDPRWMGTPTSAPRSPAVAGWSDAPVDQRRPPVAAGSPDVGSAGVGSSGDGAAGVGSAVSRRRPSPGAGSGSAVSTGRRARRIENDLLDPDPVGAMRPLVYTVACYVVPAVALFVWLLTLSGQAPAGCVTDLTGGGCDSPRAHAIGSFVAGGPRFGLALVASLVVAVLLRQVGTTWRAASVALASAVVGGGLSTVLISVVTGEPIG